MQAKVQKWVAYYRVSDAKQGRSGLGLEAQRETVRAFLRERGGRLLAEHVEVESGKSDDNRPQLHAAMDRALLTGATLVIAKLDRLSRNVSFLTGLRDRGVKFEALDVPNANTMTVTVMAAMAQQEREYISQRTKAALARSKKRLGGRRRNAPNIAKYAALGTEALQRAADEWATKVCKHVEALHAQGKTYAEIAERLNDEGAETRNGKAWTAMTAWRVHKRCAALAR